MFELPSAKLVARFPVHDLVFPYLAVGPEAPTPIPSGRKKSKLGPKGKGKLAADASAATTETEEGTPAAEDDEQEQGAEGGASAGRELTKGLAVVKLVSVGTSRADGGVVVLAAGSTALLFIPFSLLLPNSTSSPNPATAAGAPAPTPSLLPFAHPILDFAPSPTPSLAGSLAEFLISLDTTRPVATPEATPIVRAALSTGGELSAVPTLATDAVALLQACSAPSSTDAAGKGKAHNNVASVASLYPALQLLHHPGDEEFAAPAPATDDLPADAQLLAQAGVGDGKPKGGRGIKRALPSSFGEAGEVPNDKFKVGKRAIGRAETLKRYEEAKEKLRAQPGGEGLTEGEKAAVREMEDEAEQASKEGGAKVEGAMVA